MENVLYNFYFTEIVLGPYLILCAIKKKNPSANACVSQTIYGFQVQDKQSLIPNRTVKFTLFYNVYRY